jgi:signal transduction histidine kinase
VFKESEKIRMCKAGLWCINKKLFINSQQIGNLAVGHRLIRGKEYLSKEMLEKTLKDYPVEPNEIEKFKKLLNDVCVVDENAFNEKILDEFTLIENYLLADRKRVAQLEKDYNQLNYLAANLGHQFLLPVQAIVAISRNLEIDLKKNNKNHEYLVQMAQDILTETRKLAFTADNIRGLIAGDADIHRYEFRTTNIAPLIDDTIKLFSKEAIQKGVIIKDPIFKLYPNPELRLSEPHLRQVFFNLMSNAVKYSFRKAEGSERYITILCEPDHQDGRKGFSIKISNYGVGITSNELKEKIYERGYRGELTRDFSRIGSGLGLSIVKKIIEDHRGKVELSCEIRGVREPGRQSAPYLTTAKIFLPIKGP